MGICPTLHEVIHAESEIDQKERDIEQLCLKLLLQQQPVARDLRQISAALKMITDMERIGDQTQDIAEIFECGQCDGAGPQSDADRNGAGHHENGNRQCTMLMCVRIWNWQSR